MSSDKMDKVYNPKEVEDKIYKLWEENALFSPDLESKKQPYCIVIPPPNITGVLHIGHALNITIQDVLIRFYRMNGRKTLWVPGSDHAGIATHAVVEKELKGEGKTRFDIGREEFIKRVWKWKEEYGNRIMHQLKKLGSSCDWTRERFTMDAGYSKAVEKVFIEFFNKGMIYRGRYIINWCPGCQTAISNIETDYVEEQGKLWYIKYPLIKSGSEKDIQDYIIVATTRPETMLGDTAVAVNPEDQRYKYLETRKVRLPIANREIPIIFNKSVEIEFGTGAVKITPAHDPNDFEIGKEHNLEQVKIISEDATMCGDIPEKYVGLDRYKCRKMVVEDLEKQGLLEKVEDYTHSVGTCDRCHTVIEPLVSEQWFLKVKDLAGPAIDIVERDQVKFFPGKWKNYYLNWMHNIRDWCISRQLWWGHRIPVYYCKREIKNEKLKIKNCPPIVSAKKPEKCPNCGSSDIYQDEDVLDTWFSSQLWPFASLGWSEQTKELEMFYPTSSLITDRGIIFLWVSRMIMSGLYFTNEKPFEHVYIHGTVLDDQGRKMSKSLGNGIDPIEMIEKYGTDALRFSLIMLTSFGQDVYLSESKFEMGRNFVNKVWNAARLILMNLEDEEVSEYENSFNDLDVIDKWLLWRLHQVIEEVTSSIKEYKFNNATQTLYSFFWNEFCDWYLEFFKVKIKKDRKNATSFLLYIFVDILKLLHPFIPFITEEIYLNLPKKLKDSRYLMVSSWSDLKKEVYDETFSDMKLLMNTVSMIRSMRNDFTVPPGKKINVTFSTTEREKVEILNGFREYIIPLINAGKFQVVENFEKQKGFASDVVKGIYIFIELKGLIDVDKERLRLTKKITELEKKFETLGKKLANKNFIEKAPEEIVKNTEESRKKIEEELKKKKSILDQI